MNSSYDILTTRARALQLRAPLPCRPLGEEIANSILHGMGAFLAVAGLTLLSVKAAGVLGTPASAPSTRALAAYIVYTLALLMMFLASTLYHALTHEGAKRVFQVLDHSAIYLLIAGTYTPFCLVGLRGAWGWSLFGAEWALAAAGIALHAANNRALKKAEIAVYLVMGWAVVLGWIPLSRNVPFISLVFLAAGGLAYSLGILWYRLKDRAGAHVVWHVFVLAGAVCHWWAIWFL